MVVIITNVTINDMFILDCFVEIKLYESTRKTEVGRRDARRRSPTNVILIN